MPGNAIRTASKVTARTKVMIGDSDNFIFFYSDYLVGTPDSSTRIVPIMRKLVNSKIADTDFKGFSGRIYG